MEKKSYGKSVYATLNNNECQILILIFVFYFWVIIHVSYFLVVFLLYCILSAGMPVIPVFRKGSRVSWIRRSAGRRFYGAVWKVPELSGEQDRASAC